MREKNTNWDHADEMRFIRRLGDYRREGNCLLAEKLKAVEGYIKALSSHDRRWDDPYVGVGQLLGAAVERRRELLAAIQLKRDADKLNATKMELTRGNTMEH